MKRLAGPGHILETVHAEIVDRHSTAWTMWGGGGGADAAFHQGLHC